ncbi:MAG: hypothetical protein GF350_14290, partial [Chitinivibrionales bacterium]|nr:hypothetical protein [Chitinivibrionales bacterium]
MFLVVCLAILTLVRCAGQIMTAGARALAEADSLFNAGDYVHARMEYAKIRDEHPKTEAAEKAQYKLGYLNIYYGNPFADWEAALREFTKYQSLYPEGKKIEDVNCWINILHSVQSYEAGYSSSAYQARKLEDK